MQRDAGVPSTLVSIVEALLILAVVGAQALRRRQTSRVTSDAVLPAPVART
jgi:hypothetical protein